MSFLVAACICHYAYCGNSLWPIFKIISFAIGLSIQLATKHRHAHYFCLHLTLVAALSTCALRNLDVKIISVSVVTDEMGVSKLQVGDGDGGERTLVISALKHSIQNTKVNGS